MNDLEMSWKHYGTDIVRPHRVILSGWPVPTYNLDGASRSVLQTIISKIEDGTVEWIEATDAEIEAHLQTITEEPRTRKERSDKHKRRKTSKTAASATSLTPEEVPSEADD